MRVVPELRLVHDYLVHWAQAEPAREAAVHRGHRLSYRDLHAQVDQVAASLLAQGCRLGDRVAVRSDPGLDWWVVALAVMSLGGTYLGLNPKHGEKELAYVIGHAAPSLLLDLLDAKDPRAVPLAGATALNDPETRRGFLRGGYHVDADALRSARELVQPDDPAALVYTSGTTGSPKGALLPQRGLVRCNVVQARHWYDDQPPRVVVNLPVNHVGCLSDLALSTLVAGGTLLLQERFQPAQVLELIARERATLWAAVPAMFALATRAQEWSAADLSSLRRIVWSGGAMPLPVARQLAARCPRVLNCYGSTETVGSLSFTDDRDALEAVVGTVGRPDPSYDVRLVNASGSVCTPGEPGEVRVRGDHVFLGYLHDEAATAAVIDDDGYVRTGDVATQDETGAMTLVGRLCDMFKSGGYNIYPREIELALEEHPGVDQAVVVSVPDEVFGEVGHAVVTTTAQTSHEDLREFLIGRIARYKIPKRMHVASELPLLPIGKVDKRAVRSQVLAGTLGQ